MSEKHLAFFYRDCYYLVPDQYTIFEDFLQSIEVENPIVVRVLTENNSIPSRIIEKGISITPYFYSEYGYSETKIVISDKTDVFPVEVELFSQAEYNERLRNIILNYCPGCSRYKPISNRVQSLNGHFEEISLNSVCFYRQKTKPSPRVFRDNLYGLGRLWYHFDPADSKAEEVLDLIKSMIHIKYDTAYPESSESTNLNVSFKPDFFVQTLSDVLSRFIENALYFTEFRIGFDHRLIINDEEFYKQVSEHNRDNFQKNCKRYGTALAELTYAPEFDERIARSLESLSKSFYFLPLWKNTNRLLLLVLDESAFLKELHFRAPLLEAALSHIKVFNQYGKKQFRISFDMEQETV